MSPSRKPKHCSIVAGSTHSPSEHAILAPPISTQGDEEEEEEEDGKEISSTIVAELASPSMLFPVPSLLPSTGAPRLLGPVFDAAATCGGSSSADARRFDWLGRRRFERRLGASSAGRSLVEEDEEDDEDFDDLDDAAAALRLSLDALLLPILEQAATVAAVAGCAALGAGGFRATRHAAP
jgi:hypothetical protein